MTWGTLTSSCHPNLDRDDVHNPGTPIVSSLVTAWVGWVTRKPLVTLIVVSILVAMAGGYAQSTLRLQADVTELVDTEADFLQNYGAYKADYPQHRRLNVIVIDGADARRARLVETTLLSAMRAQPDLFPVIYAPGADPFLQRQALLYLDTDRLAELVDDLAAAQPALAILARDPSLRGLARLFDRVDPGGDGALARLAGTLAATAQAVRDGDRLAKEISWAELLLGDAAAPRRRLIVFQGSLGDDDGALARRQAAVIRTNAEYVSGLQDASVSMTGRGPLSSAELSSAVASIQFAGLLSLLFVVILLWIGLGSLRAIAAAVLTLAVGLVFTAAFAALTVGTLNVLSLTFAVLFIGLGIDFAIHLILRRTGEGEDDGDGSWRPVLRGLGPTLTLCGLTTAVAFLSFWPTAFRGLAELGLISAAGMVIAVIMTFTLLPVLLDLFGARDTRGRIPAWQVGSWIQGLVTARAARPVSVVALVLLVASAAVATQLRFDFNSLNLQNPGSEAVRTLVSLHEDGTITPYALTISVPDLGAVDRAAEALRAMPEVGGVKTLRDFIPAEQATRLDMIDEAKILLGPVVLSGAPVAAPSDADRMAAVVELSARAGELAAQTGDAAFGRLASALAAMASSADAAAMAQTFEGLAATDFVDSLAMLRAALSAGPVTLDTLPAELVARETGRGGALRVVALPREDLRDFAALGAFVRAVHATFPDATGRPALEAGVGEIVVDAFRQAFLTAAIAIFLILAISLRSITDAGLVMVPLLLAAGLTATVMVVFAIPLNVANVIVLPLLLGMGVDNGLHVVGRFRETASVSDVYRSTTPRAVATSALTTLLSFVALAFADHRGMASMGQLLAVAIGFMLIATLLVLPALLAWRAQSRLK